MGKPNFTCRTVRTRGTSFMVLTGSRKDSSHDQGRPRYPAQAQGAAPCRKAGDVSKTCRYFGMGRSSFYRWKAAYAQRGEVELINTKPFPKNPANQTPPEIVNLTLCHQAIYYIVRRSYDAFRNNSFRMRSDIRKR